jgi:quercetin dioxygenase-like cupin family protein
MRKISPIAFAAMGAWRATAAASLFALAFPAMAQTAEIRLTPTEVAELPGVGPGAGTSGVSGVQSRVLAGDPAKAGPYTIEIRVPPHTRIAAHGHKDDRSAVVVAGLWYFGYGKVAADALVRPLPPGSFYTEPAGVAHFAQTGDESATVYISGFGPTSTDYVSAPGS